ncbi:GNAT family N-acetyltransferase [Candidatus Woesebacteria bacterium]|nr:GNAT family N-acetyltransferase [Candidatus Woesebacteria bacterium]
MSRLFIFCGLPFSGKTTITKKLVEMFHWRRIDLDEIKFELLGNDITDEDIDQSGWDNIYQEMYQRIDNALKTGETVLNDTGNFTKSERDCVRAIGEKRGVDVVTVYVDVPAKVARKRLQENRISKLRFDVSDEAFEGTVQEMESPTESEKHITYKQNDSMDSWIAENFRQVRPPSKSPAIQVTISRPSLRDTEDLSALISNVTTDAFRRENIILSDPNILKNEFDRKLRDFQTDLATKGEQEYFLIAKSREKIVGCISFGAVTETLKEYFPEAGENSFEIKHLLVLPEYQTQGIGTTLFTSIVNELKKRKAVTYFLDSGFKTAQEYWTKRIGKPTLVLNDYFGKGQNFMLWKRSLE